MNHLVNVKKLKNNYFLMRHGKSEANVKKIIISDPIDGINSCGLVNEEEVRKSAKEARDIGLLDENVIIVSSDFKRTKETVEIVRKIFKTGNVIFSPKLRERYFGNWEKTSTSNYQKVWEDDKNTPNHKNNNVESTDEVLERTTSLIKDLEERYANKNILLVSHGDALQILQTAFERIPSFKHRSLPHLETSEIRQVFLR